MTLHNSDQKLAESLCSTLQGLVALSSAPDSSTKAMSMAEVTASFSSTSDGHDLAFGAQKSAAPERHREVVSLESSLASASDAEAKKTKEKKAKRGKKRSASKSNPSGVAGSTMRRFV